MQKITSVHLYNIALSSFFVVLTDVIYSWSYGALYDSYSGLNLVWLSSPGSSVSNTGEHGTRSLVRRGEDDEKFATVADIEQFLSEQAKFRKNTVRDRKSVV